MADHNYRRGYRDQYDRDRSFSRQEEQFEPGDYDWRDDERAHRQMGEERGDLDYGRFETSRSYRSEPSYSREADYRTGPRRAYDVSRYGAGESRGFGSFTGSDYGGRDFSGPRFTNERSYPGGLGAGSRLAANRGEWRDEYGAGPSRDYRTARSGDERGWFERAGDEVASWFGDDDAERRRRTDYRGQGPAGYTRSDERIREDACDALTDDWSVDARKIEVTVSNGDITLDGAVPSRAQKRRAEDLIDDLSGVRNVQNNLRVEQTGAWDRNNRETETAGSL